jgi:hypothetical protein
MYSIKDKERAYTLALQEAESEFGHTHIAISPALINLFEFYQRHGLTDEAIECEDRLRDILVVYQPLIEYDLKLMNGHFWSCWLSVFKCIEAISDFAEKQNLGVALIGLPGFDRRIRNYEPIDNRVGFYHVFNTPRTEELQAILAARWQSQLITIEDGAVQMLEKVTNSNIQKLVNINAEMSRVCELNSITVITSDLVELASKTLLLDTK